MIKAKFVRDFIFESKYETKQRESYDCGVAVIDTILKYYKISSKYKDLEDKLNTSKKYGTFPGEMKKVLEGFDIDVKEGLGDIGYILLNWNKFENKKDDHNENGHWVFYQKTKKGIKIFDVYRGKERIISPKDLEEKTEDVDLKDKIYNHLIFNVSKK